MTQPEEQLLLPEVAESVLRAQQAVEFAQENDIEGLLEEAEQAVFHAHHQVSSYQTEDAQELKQLEKLQQDVQQAFQQLQTENQQLLQAQQRLQTESQHLYQAQEQVKQEQLDVQIAQEKLKQAQAAAIEFQDQRHQ
ncbi:hypothetical protein [Bacillus sp. PS06]|uniref:hypothetical protein n=1 Tax=Bacillus sp. PS06 TaxID=2764176 RepID=UPI001780F51B|nr:hypothetical protein [Bacillus sp. PS06]MBD8069428.1 hypothetical protein [Bacillus sp. PS06]